MTNSISTWLSGAWLAIVVALPVAAQFEAAAVVQYTAERVLLGFTPTAMNNRGWIVGHQISYPMRYRPGVGSEQISDRYGLLTDINDAGTAVGYLFGSSYGFRAEAIIRPVGEPWKRFGSFGGSSLAFAINEAGQVVGWAADTGGNLSPFIYTEAEGMKVLVDRWLRASSINEAGQVTGDAFSPFLWDPVRGLIDIESQPGVEQDLKALAIADNGQVAGEYNHRRQLGIFSLSEGFRTVASPAGEIRVAATNDRGWIVGSYGDGATQRAFLYVYGQGVRDLNSLLVTTLPEPLIEAYDINDRDEILAHKESGGYYILKRLHE